MSSLTSIDFLLMQFEGKSVEYLSPVDKGRVHGVVVKGKLYYIEVDNRPRTLTLHEVSQQYIADNDLRIFQTGSPSCGGAVMAALRQKTVEARHGYRLVFTGENLID